MKKGLFWSWGIILIWLSACIPANIAAEIVIPTEQILVSPIQTENATALPPAIQPDNTPTWKADVVSSPIRCEASYCIFAAPSILKFPLPEGTNHIVDATYRYGTTQMGEREPHLGTDLANARGTPVLAAADGVVVVAGSDDKVHYHPYINFYGNLVIIRHDLEELNAPLFSLYAHLSEISVSAGQQVTTGEEIGKVGSSGAAIGSHLHFEVRLSNMEYTSTSNPELWLQPDMGDDILQTGILTVQVNNPEKIPLESIVIIARELNATPANDISEHYGETYARNIPSTEPWNEIAVFGNLKPGEYEIIFEKYGVYYRAKADVEPGCLSLITINL